MITLALEAKALNLAQSVLERLESNRLTRIHWQYVDELPPISGVYLAATDDGQILYVGKALNLAKRCKISMHHKLPIAIEKGAVFLYIASIRADLAWHVEQRLIDKLKPVLNGPCSRWWITIGAETLSDEESIAFAALKQEVEAIAESGMLFNNTSPEIQQFLAFVKQHKAQYKAYCGLTITEKTTPVDAFSRFCKSQLGLSLKVRKKGTGSNAVRYYCVDVEIKNS
ncbi:MAG: GIY-YIG nuclease family protein [Myxacorys californica WJT36-NPBG1]|jgi:hypothetical protein|nr:GIY-YIG nuclease family protein [Myxacorys californica WJT36-NPBG1]